MPRVVPLLIITCVAAIGVTAYAKLSPGGSGGIAVPNEANSPDAKDTDERAIEAARRSCAREAFDAVVARLRERVAAQPKDKDAWRRLANGLLQRVQQASHLFGLKVGKPVYSEVPPDVAADLDEAQAALSRAAQLGDDSAERFRIAAELMSQRITGLFTALRYSGRIDDAIRQAGERATDDPRLHLVLGVRKLLAPEFLGHDPAGALEHLSYAAEGLPGDERPALFAAMASHLQKKRLDAIAWLERAVESNPANAFTRAVLQRVRRGEEDPFSRNVTPAEISAGAAVPGR